jgi:hypothetical protein
MATAVAVGCAGARIPAMSTSTGTFTFAIHGERLAIAKLPADAAMPAWARGGFVTITRTATELSVVCAQRHVPPEVPHERDRVAFGITGTVPMTTIGILAALCGALAAARVPVFVISTYDTDWLLITAADAPAAQRALDAAGHRFTGS